MATASRRVTLLRSASLVSPVALTVMVLVVTVTVPVAALVPSLRL